MAAKAGTAPEAATALQSPSPGHKRWAGDQQKNSPEMAERMDSGSRETLRNGGVRDNKRKARKARLSKVRMPRTTGEEKQWAWGRAI